ncbi:4-hydroxyphenylpyruvate dioxygenase [Ancylothrix sp. C2]|uniref:4-hydroxyphenylpyruvate dioxygenase n=1 Tax=Ancylothrix sp. D3o TaxID=2953691 RepID=UPI0021BB495A|nr:4-hydroxyphenylpyruvate dioxygenase [Ancylothrix sp. D3o]MCT7949645.1 4-hydroxyphenylpyruvate dioxygenase [Ancylothrix sp. D3o]
MQIDHIHFYLENAKEWRNWLQNRLEFQPIATAINTHTHSEILKTGQSYFILSSPLTSASPVAHYLSLHPAGVADISFFLPKIEEIVSQLAPEKIIEPVRQTQTNTGILKWAKIRGWGDLTHTLIETTAPINSSQKWSIILDSNLTFVPTPHKQNIPILGIDHIVINVGAGELEPAITWYENTLKLTRQQSFNIQTQNSGLRSQVLRAKEGNVQLPFNEPTTKNSQIQEFLDINRGAGVQHIALATHNIITTVNQIRKKGLAFIEVPDTYYSELQNKQEINLSKSDWQQIQLSQILLDWQPQTLDADGQSQSVCPLLLQTFTQPIFKQPTFFFELIERRLEAKGFGEGNFRALFEAIERQQIKRSQ